MYFKTGATYTVNLNDSKQFVHYGYGGGFWALAYNRIPMTVTYGASKEGNLLSIKAGFLF